MDRRIMNLITNTAVTAYWKGMFFGGVVGATAILVVLLIAGFALGL